ncbi:hypothetical protein TRFO_39521 [Tritrichomonas foetus]|uniref:Uncharacterized protein n=1 Tax=Tritrichomonas foetus TaxID=1144522 RepID=A0A1J4J6I1_9EUKA|nr:hypothetical protein TRFO_39521 [Tritrichomonas foetus]|eukprot:OHS94273.1 hypothetical protein TRFO_39521 [Tritrichomonas foetus]
MNKNLQVELFYRSNVGDTTKVIKINNKTTVKILKSEIENTIFEFQSNPFILLPNSQSIQCEALNDDLKLIDLLPSGTLKLKALPLIIDVYIKIGEVTKIVPVHVTKPINEILKDLKNNDHPSRNVFAFKNQENIFSVCCSTLPLCAHEWWYDELFLIRRLYRDDQSIAIDEDYRNFLIKNANFAVENGLSGYSIDIWAKLAAFRIIADHSSHMLTQEKTSSLKSYIQENLSKYVSPYVLNDGNLIPQIIHYYNCYHTMDQSTALLQYIKESSENGCQCAYVESVKFGVKSAIQMFVNRFIFISPSNIKIFKKYGYKEKHSKKFRDILECDFENQHTLKITFKENEAWLISHKNTSKLKRLMTVLKTISVVSEAEPQTVKRINSIHGEFIGDFHPNLNSVSKFEFSGNEEESLIKKERETVKYSKIIIPEGDPNEKIDFVKDSIKVIKIVKDVEICDDNNKNDNIEINIEKFFSFDKDEGWKKNPFALFLLVLIAFDIIKIVFHYYLLIVLSKPFSLKLNIMK